MRHNLKCLYGHFLIYCTLNEHGCDVTLNTACWWTYSQLWQTQHVSSTCLLAAMCWPPKELRTDGKVNPETSKKRRGAAWVHTLTAYWQCLNSPKKMWFNTKAHKNSKENADITCQLLTWLMCLSLSIIWLIIVSGGLLLLDSEPGCILFRPGPGNLKEPGGKCDSVFTGVSWNLETSLKASEGDMMSIAPSHQTRFLTPPSVDNVNDSYSGLKA